MKVMCYACPSFKISTSSFMVLFISLPSLIFPTNFAQKTPQLSQCIINLLTCLLFIKNATVGLKFVLSPTSLCLLLILIFLFHIWFFPQIFLKTASTNPCFIDLLFGKLISVFVVMQKKV